MPDLGPIAATEWMSIVPMLPAELLTKVDGKALGCYCEAYEDWVEAKKLIKKHGRLIQTFSGLKANPALRFKNEAYKIMKSFLVEFGLTPASRSKLKIEPKRENDAFEKFLSGKDDQAEDESSVN